MLELHFSDPNPVLPLFCNGDDDGSSSDDSGDDGCDHGDYSAESDADSPDTDD